MSLVRRAALYYAAASLGGLAVVLTGWGLGQLGVPRALGVAVNLPLDLAWIYRAMVWGGIWGFIFLLPLPIRPLWLKGLLLTLAPVLAALVYFGPARGGMIFALDRGEYAPFYIYAINSPWGLVTAYLGRALGGDERS